MKSLLEKKNLEIGVDELEQSIIEIIGELDYKIMKEHVKSHSSVENSDSYGAFFLKAMTEQLSLEDAPIEAKRKIRQWKGWRANTHLNQWLKSHYGRENR